MSDDSRPDKSGWVLDYREFESESLGRDKIIIAHEVSDKSDQLKLANIAKVCKIVIVRSNGIAYFYDSGQPVEFIVGE